MTNKEIAKQFQLLADLMELHEENPYKIKSYQSAYLLLRKFPKDLEALSLKELEQIKGIGTAISAKIRELIETGKMSVTQSILEKTPPGIVEMLKINGFGPKKVRIIWKELGVETIGELSYACNENRLIELKGFGPKTQDELISKLAFFQQSRGLYLYSEIEKQANSLLLLLRSGYPEARVELTGSLRRRNTTLSQIEILLAADKFINDTPSHQDLTVESIDENIIKGHFRTVPFSLYTCKMEESGSKQFMYTASESFMTEFLRLYPGIDFRNIREEKDVFKKVKLAFMEPELREDGAFLLKAATGKLPELIDFKDIKGVVHTHSLYSDGMNSIEEMADHALKLGYQYIGISDHSKSAAYANGLKEEKILEQWTEIEKLNRQFAPFRIFRGIESDILHDGSLDYSDEILQQFDFIIASVHSNLQMDEQKATARLIRAIENPYTTILGHPTGRLLLAREGYKPDFEKVMDACAANKVAIELNANPHRLDLDWSLIQKALDKGILISINPDAHSIQGLSDIHFGVLAARKGGLTRDSCLTCFDVADFADFIEKRKS